MPAQPKFAYPPEATSHGANGVVDAYFLTATDGILPGNLNIAGNITAGGFVQAKDGFIAGDSGTNQRGEAIFVSTSGGVSGNSYVVGGGVSNDFYITRIPTAGPAKNVLNDDGAGVITIGEGAGSVNIYGASGTGRVYDAVNNRPLPGADTVIGNMTAVGVLTPTPYTTTKAGWYYFSVQTTCAGAGAAFAFFNDAFQYNLTSGGSPVTGSYMCCSAVSNGSINEQGILIDLPAGVTVQPAVTVIGAPNLGASGGAQFVIQPALA